MFAEDLPSVEQRNEKNDKNKNKWKDILISLIDWIVFFISLFAFNWLTSKLSGESPSSYWVPVKPNVSIHSGDGK